MSQETSRRGRRATPRVALAGVGSSGGASALSRINRGRWVERVTGYLIFFGIWFALHFFVFEEFVLPSPVTVVQEMGRLASEGLLLEHGAVTFSLIFRAFAIAVVVGTAIGVAMGLSRWFDGFFRDGLLLSFTTPGLIFVLISLLIFGLSWIGPVLAIVLPTIPYVAINVWEGVRAIPRDTMDMATAFRMSMATRLRHVVIPAVAPYLFTGIRFAFSQAWKIAMLTEIFGGDQGIGYNIRVESIQFRMATLLAWVLWFFVAAIILERLVLQRLVKRSLRWRKEIAS